MNKEAQVSNAENFLANSGGANLVQLDPVTGNLVQNEQMIANDNTLRHEDWLLYDQTLLQIARDRLNGIMDLMNAGLVKDVGGIGTIISMYERVGDMTPAIQSLDGETMSQDDRVTVDEVGVPIPITHKDWSTNERQMASDMRSGGTLDTTQMETSARLVSDTLENMLFRGSTFRIGDNRIYGYTNHPNRQTIDLTGASGWTAPASSDIVGDTKRMLNAMYAQNRFGPFTMYVAKDIWAEIQMDYSDEKGDRTFKERIMAFDDIVAVKAGDKLPNGNVVLVQLTSDVVDIAVAADMQNLAWNKTPFTTQYKVWAAMAPRIKADRNNSCGVVHATP